MAFARWSDMVRAAEALRDLGVIDITLPPEYELGRDADSLIPDATEHTRSTISDFVLEISVEPGLSGSAADVASKYGGSCQ
ncbi:hypothetical protein CBW46_020390 [Paenibacillus xerothermodurans]|uniref:Uncharacterized protein n=2 Tax=Paenibacillus xerothermodurans TaxID=1977292 RepID=A0A2W1NJ29_PAEXE|nr:hypothetical protein CBW46_020390 [Paenibacillus xerothermodurans]